jgi:hypothetical protein
LSAALAVSETEASARAATATINDFLSIFLPPYLFVSPFFWSSSKKINPRLAIIAKILAARTGKSSVLACVNPCHPNRIAILQLIKNRMNCEEAGRGPSCEIGEQIKTPQ